jgi:hypothetical protein
MKCTKHHHACACREAAFKKAQADAIRFRAAIERTIAENAHLADGDDCALALLKQAIAGDGFELR